MSAATGKLLTITQGPSKVILNSRLVNPLENTSERSVVTFSGHYRRESDKGSITIAVNGLVLSGELGDDNFGKEFKVSGILMARDGVAVDDEEEVSFHYSTVTHRAHHIF